MKPKLLVAALAAAGMISSGTAYALSLNPADWFHSERAAQSEAPQKLAQADRAAPNAPSANSGSSPATTMATAASSADAAQPAGRIEPPSTTGSVVIAPTTAPNWTEVVQRFGPAVVGVEVEGTREVGSADAPDIQNDPFFRFYRGLPIPQMPHGKVPVRGQGSGFIVGSDGIILTNAHVVRDADSVRVKLADRREYSAKVLGVDPATDVAVLKIDAKNLPTVQLGESERLHVGDYVLAIGSPFGFEESATSGIVSAKGRALPGDSYVPFIQTDVAVNPGNSGGPLFDAGGRVVGINSQIYSRTGGYEGLSFAIPIDVALRVKDQIVETGQARHAQLGVTIQELNQALADSFKLKNPNGALISSIAPDSAAQKAGLKPGDVILSFNGKPVEQSGDLAAMVGMTKPGAKVALEVMRDGKKQQIDATLGEAKPEQVASSESESPNANSGRLGLAVRPLDNDERKSARIDKGGLLVEDATGAARRAGIRPGDVILSVNGQSVDSVESLRDKVSGDNDKLALLVQRGNMRIFVPLNLG
ncbi:MAG: DegQ family serine endoprotease [Burkholderiaceae bacterium]|nr:DegQ family serine endoprotease [Burkholderiaceae bacterium]